MLCASNAIGLVVLAPFFRKDLAWSKLKEVTQTQWAALVASSWLYAVVGPWFELQAWTLVSVATSSVLARVQSALWFALSIAVLKTPFCWWDATNTALTLLGVVLSIALTPLYGGCIDFSLGHIYVIISATAYALSLTVMKRWLQEMLIGLLVVFRFGVGTVAFHSMAHALGQQAKCGAFYSPNFWCNMLWFGLVYVVGAQGFWLAGFRLASTAFINTVTTAQFVLTLLCSIVIQHVLPTPTQSIAAVVLTLSIVSGIAKELHSQRLEPAEAAATSSSKATSSDGDILQRNTRRATTVNSLPSFC